MFEVVNFVAATRPPGQKRCRGTPRLPDIAFMIESILELKRRRKSGAFFISRGREAAKQ